MRKIVPEDITQLITELALILESQISVVDAVTFIQQESEKPALSRLISAIQDNIVKGMSLADSWAKYPHYFPTFLVDLLRQQGEQNLATTLTKIAQYRESMLAHCTGKRGQLKQSGGRNWLNRLKKPEPRVLAFALEPGIPFTHNPAERDLRPVKVKQPVSGGFRTQLGAHRSARLQAVISTFRKPRRQGFAVLRDLCSRHSIVVV